MFLAEFSMPPKIVIVDYQLGNLYSVKHACERVGMSVEITSDVYKIIQSEGVVLPGVGAFGDAMRNLRRLKLDNVLRDYVAKGRPFFGICLGMQLLFEESEEFGVHEGLGILPGLVRRLPTQIVGGRRLKIPNVGWNSVECRASQDLSTTPLRGVKLNDQVYFVHSFHAIPTNDEDALTYSYYGQQQFCSSIMRNNLFACQFHPEKSGHVGLQIYANWFRTLTEEK
jgi:glutamine amidotransferase